jgi:hypothetical protein
MKVSKASKIWLDYHHTNSKKNTYRSYSVVMGKILRGLWRSST